MKQRTLRQEATIKGKALHTGASVTLTLKPAPPDHGIVFRRVDLYGKPELRASVDFVSEVVRSTTLSTGHTKVHTVEHVLSALNGLGVDNAVVEMDASEPPILDGSAQPYAKLIDQAGIQEQDAARDLHRLDEPISVTDGNRSLVALPFDGLRITCTSTDDRGIHTQHLSIDIDVESYRTQIAPARTFTIYEDIEELLKMGKIQGGSLDSAIVIKGDSIMSKEPLRFKDEFVRHKILDVIGDLSLLGMPIKAHIVAVRPGHALNAQLTRAIIKRRDERLTGQTRRIGGPEQRPLVNPLHDTLLDIRSVLDTLPHRYPFLLIDRVVEIKDRDEITAIKNVTYNEPYFQGHFPGQPVLPGVLQIEAMAQAGGILMLRHINKPGQVCYFMSCDKVKFRQAITPGDQVEVHCRVKKLRLNKIALMEGECRVNGKIASTGELMFTLVDTGGDV